MSLAELFFSAVNNNIDVSRAESQVIKYITSSAYLSTYPPTTLICIPNVISKVLPKTKTTQVGTST